MMSATQDTKRSKAAVFPSGGPVVGDRSPSYGSLDVKWESTFDRMCFGVSAENLATKNPRRYKAQMDEISRLTGCTEEEILAHGGKVRGRLFFAHEKLERQGLLQNLGPKEKYEYTLPTVTPAF